MSVTVTVVAAVAVATGRTVSVRMSVTAIAAAAFRTRTPLRLNIAFRFRKQGLHGKTHLAGLLVDLEELDIYFIAELYNILDLFGLLPSHLGNVEQAFLARKYLYKGSEVLDGSYLSVVNLAQGLW